MKKKIIALCLIVALAITAVTGATLAYFTDTATDVNNTFAIGNIDIELTETAGVKDQDDNDIDGLVEKNNNGGYKYAKLMPGYKLTKTPVVTNTGDNTAYVRVFVTINNYLARNAAIDEVYEKGETPEQAHLNCQAMYDEIFDEWGINNIAAKDGISGYNNEIRNSMKQRTGVQQIDSVRCPGDNAGYQWEGWNVFKSETERNEGSLNVAYGSDVYYKDALARDSSTYIFYLMLPAGEGYTLFNGLNIPAEFTADQMAMFDGLEIGVYADAIQADGFNDTKDTDGNVTEAAWVKAFNELEKTHHMGWWNKPTT